MEGKISKCEERKFITEFIRLYRKLPSLWNTKNTDYYDRIKKKSDYKILLTKYKEMFNDATNDDVKKKINSLRCNSRKEFKKYLKSKKPGSGYMYQPTLWYYKEMEFLQDQECQSDDQYLDIQEESTSTPSRIEDTPPSPIPCDPVPRKKETKRILIEEFPEFEHIEMQPRRFRHELDEYENWALSCAADLKKMDSLQQIYAKNAIGAIIMEGRLGLLNRYSVKINEPIPQKYSTASPSHYSSTP